jgi:hypothetical protein
MTLRRIHHVACRRNGAKETVDFCRVPQAMEFC